MLRHLLATTLLGLVLVGAVAATAASCNAQVSESCVGGPCGLGGAGGATSTSATTSASSTGASSSGATTASASASSSSGGPDARHCPTTPKTGDIPCDVFAVIHSICNQCHTSPPKNFAPFPILTYADTQQPFIGLHDNGCVTDADCGPTPGSCVNGMCNGLRFQQMWLSIGGLSCPQMPYMETPICERPDGGAEQYATLHDWLGNCAPPVPAGTGCGCPGMGCTAE
jgi:hypothetical protein